MAEFTPDDNLRGAQFREVDFTGARFRGGNFTDVKMTDMWMVNVDIDGLINHVTVNGVDVVPLVVAELDRLQPERKLLRATDPDGLRSAWQMLTEKWDATIDRARQLPASKPFESVDDEWSFVETLRHLVFATDKWFTAPVLGGAYHPIGLPNSGSGNLSFLGIDERADPTLDDVLGVRRDRVARVGEYLAAVTPDDLAQTRLVLGAGSPSIRACLHVVFDEEWAHHRYATRDLDILERA
jgi:hypothetical protein